MELELCQMKLKKKKKKLHGTRVPLKRHYSTKNRPYITKKMPL